MPRATAVHWEKLTDKQGNIMELAIWKVPATPHLTAGIRYRLAFVRRGTAAPAVLYDNHPPKGHHRHIEGVEEVYEFVDVPQLLSDFMADVSRIAEREDG